MKSLLKRAKQEGMAYFNSPIAIKHKSTEEWGVKYVGKKCTTAIKMGKSRPKKGYMHGEVK